MDQIKIYAATGLRTLLLAKKVIAPHDYALWSAEWDKASAEVFDRDQKLEALSAQLETEMSLVGATAIEDRLQDEVAETISMLKAAGIKVWVLTGDKIETAVNIGFSTALLDNGMQRFYVTDTDLQDIKV